MCHGGWWWGEGGETVSLSVKHWAIFLNNKIYRLRKKEGKKNPHRYEQQGVEEHMGGINGNERFD